LGGAQECILASSQMSLVCFPHVQQGTL
jgi:hypothetical protein